MDPKLASALFSPRSVALVGASADPTKNTGRPQRYLARHGFAGTVVPINPGRALVQGASAYAHLDAAPHPIDHAFIMTPRDDVLPAIEACARKGIGIATVYSDGFADAGDDGRALEKALVTRARALGVRIVGPNSMGVINAPAGITLSVNAALEAQELLAGGLSVVSQSGTVLGTLLSRGQARGFGFAKLVSVGNEADVGVGELVEALADDADTRAILLFLETFRDAARLGAAARRALAQGRPVIAFKLGRSAAGQALARSHTGAITGGAPAAQAFFRAHGIVPVDQLETLFEIAPLLLGQTPKPRHRVAVVSTTGGGAGMVVDRLGMLGVDPIPAPAVVVERMAGFGIRVGAGPVIDLTMAGARGEVYGAALDALLDDPGCDAIVAVVGSSAQHRAEVAVAPIVARARRHGRGAGKPIAAFFAPQADESLRRAADAGVAAFRTPEACADAVSALLRWRSPAPPVDVAHEVVGVVDGVVDTQDLAGEIVDTQTIAPGASGAPPGRADTYSLDESQALALFERLGIHTVPRLQLDLPLGAKLPEGLTYPLALKILSPDIAHKSDAGGVALGIVDEAGLREAAGAIVRAVQARAPGARIRGLLAQPMCAGLGEVLVGYRLDPEVGPLVSVGPGGLLAELYASAAVRLAPVNLSTALEMIEEARGLALLRGYRARPPGDLAALARAVCALSSLARLEGPPILEAEINPLIVRTDGASAVDGLVLRASQQTII